MSDTTSLFKKCLTNTFEGALRVEHGFEVANSPWSNRTCEQMMGKVVRALKVVSKEKRRDIREWMDAVPTVQCALNTAYSGRYASTPYHVMFGQAPLISFTTLASLT